MAYPYTLRNLMFKNYYVFLMVGAVLIRCLHCVFACLQMVCLCYHKALIYKELRISCLFLSFVFYEKAVYLCKQKRETDRHGKKQVSVSAMLVDTRQKKYRSSFYS